MWIPQSGYTLEKAHEKLKTFIIHRAQDVWSEAHPDIDLTRKPKFSSESEQENWKRNLQLNAGMGSKVLLREILNRSSKQMLFACDVSGNVVSLPTSALSFGASRLKNEKQEWDRKLGRAKIDKNATEAIVLDFWNKVREFGANPYRLRTIDMYQSDYWVEPFLLGTLFDSSTAHHNLLAKEPENTIDIRSGVVDLRILRQLTSGYQNISQGVSNLSEFGNLPKTLSRYAVCLPILENVLNAYKAIEGWRVIVDGSLIPADYVKTDNRVVMPFPQNKQRALGRPKKGEGVVAKAIANEFMKRFFEGEISLGDKKEAVLEEARQWALEILDQEISRSTAQRYLEPVFEAMTAQN